MEESEESRSSTKVGLLSLPPIKSGLAEQFGVMGLVTPPHHSASVPFRWEEEPGKPRSSSSSSSTTPPLQLKTSLGLDLPPRLRFMSKTASPTSVLDSSRSIFHSFRLTRNRHVSFDDDGTVSSLGLSRRWFLLQTNKNKPEEGLVHQGTFVFSARKTGVTTTLKKKTLLGSNSNFWATIYGAVKQVIPTQRRTK